MLFDKAKLSLALDHIGNNYRKILLVNLSTDNYQPVTIADDEWNILRDNKTYKISEYWDWFCNSKLLHDDDRKTCMEYTMEPNTHLVYRRKMQEEWHWVLMEIIPAKDYTVDNRSCVLYVRDIHNIYLPEYEAVVEHIGTTDAMTGLYNKVAFERDKERHKGEKVGIIFADLNGLKYANDNMGHKAGDELITKFAGLLSVNFSGYKCYHISGDEFVVCAFSASLREFLSKAIAFHKSMWIAMDMPLASIGYSIGEANEFQLAYDEAEKDMYDDKRIFYSRFPKYKRK